MQFTNPIALWGLLGLTLPVAIHLLSRKEGKVIRIGSLRHLHETNTQQFKGIRLNEIVLLSLRSLLILLFVLLLSGLSFEQKTTSEAKWVVVERGLENHPDVKGQLEKFQTEGYELHWLTSGFPLLQDSTDTSPLYYRGAIEKLADQNFSEGIVIVQNKVGRFVGVRSSLPSNIRWISITPEAGEYTLGATTYSDSVLVKTGYTDAAKTYFTSQRVPALSWKGNSDAPEVIKIGLVSDKKYAYERKIIEAALRSIESSFAVKLEMYSASAQPGWTIWLSDQDFANTNTPIIYLKPTSGYKLILQETHNRWRITKSLNEEIALQENLTIQLASILIPSSKLNEVAAQHDQRMAPDSLAWDEKPSENKINASAAQSADAYLIGLLLTILFIERILAYHRNQ
jgi:hypothetical protein